MRQERKRYLSLGPHLLIAYPYVHGVLLKRLRCYPILKPNGPKKYHLDRRYGYRGRYRCGGNRQTRKMIHDPPFAKKYFELGFHT